MLGKFVDQVLAEEELKELGLGDFGSEFDIIEAPFTKLIDYQRLVVFKDAKVHRSTP